MLLFVPKRQLIQAELASFGTSPAVQKEQEEDPVASEIFPVEHSEHSSFATDAELGDRTLNASVITSVLSQTTVVTRR